MGFVGARSEESGACVRVSWTYLNISPWKEVSERQERAAASGAPAAAR